MTATADMRRLINLLTESLREDAWHGSPHAFTQFRTSRIGTGEGAQVYGWGLYFTDTREIAEYYRKTLSQYSEARPTVQGRDILDWFREANFGDMVENVLGEYARNKATRVAEPAGLLAELEEYAERSRSIRDREGCIQDARAFVAAVETHGIQWNRDGRLYKVAIPDDGHYILWDRPFAEQPPAVQAAFRELDPFNERSFQTSHGSDRLDAIFHDPDFEDLFGNATPIATPEPEPINYNDYTGKQLYEQLAAKLYSPKAASLALRDHGVAGIKYLDGNSRDVTGRDDLSYNYVVFDDAKVAIQHKE